VPNAQNKARGTGEHGWCLHEADVRLHEADVRGAGCRLWSRGGRRSHVPLAAPANARCCPVAGIPDQRRLAFSCMAPVCFSALCAIICWGDNRLITASRYTSRYTPPNRL
jgi:hypothetical protein